MRPGVVGEAGGDAAIPGGVGGRPHEVGAGAVAVVVHGLLHAVAVGVELSADVGQRVPLRGVLQGERDHVVGPDVYVLRIAEVGPLGHGDVLEGGRVAIPVLRSEEHTSELPSLMRTSYSAL